MPMYVLLSTLTPHGRESVHTNPERVLGVNQEVERFGCRVIEQYAVLGPYDFVTLLEAPDNETVAHMSVDLGSRGTVSILTLPAIDMGAFTAKLRSAEQLAATPVVGGQGPASREQPSAGPTDAMASATGRRAPLE